MVLQRDLPLRVWGTGKPGETVRVECGVQSASGTIEKDGAWLVELPGQSDKSPIVLTATSAGQKVSVKDARLGEVWLCSGQSNMQWPMNRTDGWEAEQKVADNPNLMLFSVPTTIAPFPIKITEGKWKASNALSASWFSGVAYYFGKQLQQELDVPVGLVRSAVGGTNAIAWVNGDLTRNDPQCQHYWQTYVESIAQQAQLKLNYLEKLETWIKSGKKPPMPQPPMGLGNFNTPAALYNGMIVPLVPMSFRGVIWYQGESNSAFPNEYQQLFTTLIESWREDFRQPDMPFFFAQLAAYEKNGPNDRSFADLRQAQLETLKSVPGTGMVVLIDTGLRKNVHPTDKRTVGERFARQIMAEVYKNQGALSGPIFRSAKVTTEGIKVSFEHAEDLAVFDGGALQGFSVAYQPGVFVPALAEIDGENVRIHVEKERKPLALGYAYTNWPELKPNLTNATGLPASPFKVSLVQ